MIISKLFYTQKKSKSPSSQRNNKLNQIRNANAYPPFYPQGTITKSQNLNYGTHKLGINSDTLHRIHEMFNECSNENGVAILGEILRRLNNGEPRTDFPSMAIDFVKVRNNHVN